jgi:hypothetical protein
MSGTEHPIEWYLARDGQQFGPLSDVELKKFIELGHLRPTDLLWRHGLPDWRPASAIFSNQRPTQAPATAPTAQQRAPEQRAPEQRAPEQRAPEARRPEQRGPDPRAQGQEPKAGPEGIRPGAANTAAPGGGPAAATRPAPNARTADPGAPQRGGPRPQRPVAQRAPMRPERMDDAPPRRRSKLPLVASLLLVVLAGGAFALHKMGRLSPMMAQMGLSELSSGVTGSTDRSSGGSPALASQDNLSRSPLEITGASSEEVDASFQKTALWRLLKTEFPSWYADRVRDTARLGSEQKDAKAVSQQLAEAVVALRRQHVGDALSASAPRLRDVASSFLDNLGRLAGHSVEACYNFISQGETSPQIVELMRASEYTPRLQKQVVSVFEAIIEGKKSPRPNAPPRREDYDALAAQLAKRGWSPADLQLFSDARQLSRAPPQKVCQMVQDWFSAQLSITDEEVQMRLLVEALKPVVAG